MGRRRKEPEADLTRELRRVERLIKRKPVLLAQAFLVLGGSALVALTIVGSFNIWHQTTTTATKTASTTSTVTNTIVWSDARITTLLGTGVVLILIGLYFTRITGVTMGGFGVTMGAVAAALARKVPEKPALKDPTIFAQALQASFVNYTDIVGGARVLPIVQRLRPADTVERAEIAYATSPLGRRRDSPNSLAEVAVDKALADLDI